MRLNRGRVGLALFVVVTCSVLALVLPDHRTVIFEIALLCVLALALLEASAQARALRATKQSSFVRSFVRSGPTAPRPDDLVALERAIGWHGYDRRDFDHRVLPVIRRIASARLQQRRGFDYQDRAGAGSAPLPPLVAGVLEGRTSEELGIPERLDARTIDQLLNEIEAI